MALLIIVFAVLFFTQRSRFFNVYWLGLILILCMLYILEVVFLEPAMGSEYYYLLLSIFIFGFVPFSLLLLSIITFFNSKVLMEKEGRRIRNLLISSIGAAALLILFISIAYYLQQDKTTSSEFIYFYMIALFVYFLWLFTSCALYSWLYIVTPIHYKPDYIIVLGSGLIGDRVPPLLASRIDKAMQQYKKYGCTPLLIMSGGQGSDELVSEASAMKKYVLDHYEIESDAVLIEDRSTTTYENLLFSKAIIDQKVTHARGIFVTNNFHVFRASLYAVKVNLNAVGRGAKTAFYYLPNAFMREYIALLEMTKWRQLLIIGGFTAIWFLIMRNYS